MARRVYSYHDGSFIGVAYSDEEEAELRRIDNESWADKLGDFDVS